MKNFKPTTEMTVTVTYIANPNSLEELIRRNDTLALTSLLNQKKEALLNASKNVEHWLARNMPTHEFCLNEKSRMDLLSGQIEQIEKTLN
jgi:hypothetical protein